MSLKQKNRTCKFRPGFFIFKSGLAALSPILKPSMRVKEGVGFWGGGIWLPRPGSPENSTLLLLFGSVFFHLLLKDVA